MTMLVTARDNAIALVERVLRENGAAMRVPEMLQFAEDHDYAIPTASDFPVNVIRKYLAEESEKPDAKIGRVSYGVYDLRSRAVEAIRIRRAREALLSATCR